MYFVRRLDAADDETASLREDGKGTPPTPSESQAFKFGNMSKRELESIEPTASMIRHLSDSLEPSTNFVSSRTSLKNESSAVDRTESGRAALSNFPVTIHPSQQTRGPLICFTNVDFLETRLVRCDVKQTIIQCESHPDPGQPDIKAIWGLPNSMLV